MIEKIKELGGTDLEKQNIDLTANLIKLKIDAYMAEPKQIVAPKLMQLEPRLDVDTDRRRKNGREITWPGSSENKKNGPLKKPKPEKWDINIGEPKEPIENCVSVEAIID